MRRDLMISRAQGKAAAKLAALFVYLLCYWSETVRVT
jgi:hypothetical protein